MRYTPVFVAGLLFGGAALAARPFDEDVLGDIGGTLPIGLEWWAMALYFVPIALACFAPRRMWYVMPIAFCWPFVFWLGVWLLRG